MASQTTQLIVELLDKVSAPARAVGRSLLGISRTVKDANGQKIGFHVTGSPRDHWRTKLLFQIPSRWGY